MMLLIVTLTSLLLAVIMSAIAWRTAADERRRSEARVAELSADIHAAASIPVPIAARAGAARRGNVSVLADAPRPAIEWHYDLELRPRGQRVAVPAGPVLFEQTTARSGSRMLAVFVGGVLVMGAAVATTMLAPGRFGGAPQPTQVAAPATPAEAPPLELVALGHERVGDELTVRGIVRNPSAGAGLSRLTAVVVLQTPDGGFVEGGRHDVETALEPGGEAKFVVTVPRAGDVGRYRVSFRTDDRIVSHVDRRHEQS